MILYPDMATNRYQHSDTFVFAAPIDTGDWERLRARAERSKTRVPKGPHFVILEDEADAGLYGSDQEISIWCRENEDVRDVCIVLREGETDDECIAAGAWVRAAKQYSGFIFCCPQAGYRTVPETINSTAACNQEQVVMVDF